MTPERIGYGMGAKDFEAANCVRAILGSASDGKDEIAVLSFNVDDMTAEEIGFAMERFFEGGALEVYTVACGMKKSRPGTLVRVMVRPGDREAMLELIFRHTTTIGVREAETKRRVMQRRSEIEDTPFGPIRRKISEGFGTVRMKYEYEDVARAARETGMSLYEVKDALDEKKLERLNEILAGFENLAVAYSAGVDSTFLLAAEHAVLGERAAAISRG